MLTDLRKKLHCDNSEIYCHTLFENYLIDELNVKFIDNMILNDDDESDSEEDNFNEEDEKDDVDDVDVDNVEDDIEEKKIVNKKKSVSKKSEWYFKSTNRDYYYCEILDKFERTTNSYEKGYSIVIWFPNCSFRLFLNNYQFTRFLKLEDNKLVDHFNYCLSQNCLKLYTIKNNQFCKTKNIKTLFDPFLQKVLIVPNTEMFESYDILNVKI